jgi:hypothetical protein
MDQRSDARHCGLRPHLHDDLDTITLTSAAMTTGAVQVWPTVERSVPPDVERFLEAALAWSR